MSKHAKCTGKTLQDCFECGMYYSSLSAHYNKALRKVVTEITCSHCGNRLFDENGREVTEGGRAVKKPKRKEVLIITMKGFDAAISGLRKLIKATREAEYQLKQIAAALGDTEGVEL